MAEENNLRVKITASDRASAVIDNLRRRLGSIETPAGRAAKGMRGIAERGTEIERFARSQELPRLNSHFERFANHAFSAFRNVSRLSGEMEGLAGLMERMGPLGVAIGAGLLAKRWAGQGIQLKNTAANIGVTPGQLFRYRRAAAGVGVSPESITGDLMAINRDAFNARINKDPAMVQAFRQLGIPLYGKNGAPASTASIMSRLATVLPTLSPQGQQMALSALGLDPSSMPLFRKGSSWLTSRLEQLKREGIKSSAYSGAGALYQDFSNIDTAAIAATNALAIDFAPAVGYATKALSSFLLGLGGKNGIVNKDGSWFSQLWNANPFGLNKITPAQAWNQFNSPTAGPNGVARSLRDNNPLNLSYVPGQRGLVGRDGQFGRYGTMADGVSAAVNQIMIDRSRGDNTIRKLVTSWAPPGSNDTAAYIRNVSKWTGYAPDQPLNLSNPRVMSAVVSAMARQEGSGRLSPSDLASGVLGGYRQFASGAPRALPTDVTTELAKLRAAQAGKVTVDINHNGAPAGVTARASADGSASIGTLRVVRTMTPAEAYP